MNRLTAYVSGRVQKVGYRRKVARLAVAFCLKGMVEHLDDGRVKIIAEGDDERLKWFENAIDIKESPISVLSIEKTYSAASGELQKFVIFEGPEDEECWLDSGLEILEEMLVAFQEMNKILVEMNRNLGEKLDRIVDTLE